jgi:NAD(P)-dependent dehydrogenase (short-subunit alcohol dehydrogenase family)
MKIGGSVALVIGANRGIGEAFGAELLRRGAPVRCAYRALKSLPQGNEAVTTSR